MKSDAHLYVTAEPLQYPLPALRGLCSHAIAKPEIVAVWDTVPVGAKLETERLSGICHRCIKRLEELQPDGIHQLYAVREFRKPKGATE